MEPVTSFWISAGGFIWLMLKRREELSGLSKETDLNDDVEDEEGLFRGVVGCGGSCLGGGGRQCGLEKSSGNQALNSFSVLISQIYNGNTQIQSKGTRRT